MEKEFIPYNEALALRGLGFDEPCFGYFIELRNPQEGILNIEKRENNFDGLLAPTFSQAFRFFREKHDLISVIGYHNIWEYSFLIETIKEHKTIVITDKFNTYEEAELECLKKLIEIVKGL